MSASGTDEARSRLQTLFSGTYSRRDQDLEEYAEAFSLLLERGIEPGGPWEAWRLGMVLGRAARMVMAVPAGPPQAQPA